MEGMITFAPLRRAILRPSFGSSVSIAVVAGIFILGKSSLVKAFAFKASFMPPAFECSSGVFAAGVKGPMPITLYA